MSKIVFIISEDWFFCSHFLPMARAARESGLEVVVATRLRDHRTAIETEGFRPLHVDMGRGLLNPWRALRAIGDIAALLRSERPQIVHAVALPCVVLGGIAAALSGARNVVLAPTGLGHLWIETGLVTRFVRSAVRGVVRRLMRRDGTRCLFENDEDPREFGLDPSDPRKVTLVPGAGVDPAAWPVAAEPDAPPVRVAIVSRMLYAKGIDVAVEAVRRARARGVDVVLDLYGEPDRDNRRSIPEATLRAWSQESGIHWHGPTRQVADVWAASHVALLMSKREGLPRALIEAMVCGRPVIASDVTGCRTLVRNGIDGVLVPAGDVDATADAIVHLAVDAPRRHAMGLAARARIVSDFSEARVQDVVRTVYREMLASR